MVYATPLIYVDQESARNKLQNNDLQCYLS